jgi:hypothetical protein
VATATQSGARAVPRPLASLALLPSWALPAVTAAGAAVGCAVLAVVDPSQPGRYPTCPFLALTGRWCPGCGSLRAVYHLTHGNLAGAVGLNALLVVALPYLVYGWASWACARAGGPRLRPVATGPLATKAVVVAVLGFWVLRNVPVAPFTALAP